LENSSQLSSTCAIEARETVLSFFRAPPEYTVIFTSNATGALKLVGESYPFTENGSFILGSDSHNSVHGIRQFARRAGSQVVYLESPPRGGLDESFTKVRARCMHTYYTFLIHSSFQAVLMTHRPRSRNKSNALFALTGASNVSNSKNSLSLIEYASALGYHTLLDAAALAPSSLLSLWDTPVDAMAVSFYKMFGFPTGVGALIVKKSFLAQLRRPWFAGGTVDIVQVPGTLITMAPELHEQFEVRW
jgi:molybdenum cofactor sulfurtransferase